jgi:hypothetical protein
MSPRPDPPGSSDFVFRYIDAIFDGAGTASTLTDPPPIETPSEKHCVLCSSAPKFPPWPTITNKLNTNNDNDATALSTSEDPPTKNNATSTRMICPCACAAMQRFGKDTDKIDNAHPFYRIWYPPLWKEAIKSLQLYDYKDSPYYSLTQLEPTSIASAQDRDPLSNIILEDTMRCFNSEIFDK